MSIKVKNFFPGYIGQSAAISELNEMLTLEEMGKAFPLRPLNAVGMAGLGKTTLWEAYAKAREGIHGGEHRFMLLNSATVTRPILVKTMIDHANGNPATIFFDEAQDLEKRVRNLLKSLTETGGQIKDIHLADNCIYSMNPFQVQFLFASNEDTAAKDPALFGPTGRCTDVRYVPLTESEKRAMIRLMVSQADLEIHPEAVEFLAGRVWPNPRSIMREMGTELIRKATLAGGKITLQFAKDFCSGLLHSNLPAEERQTVARYPRGLTWFDVKAMRYLGSEVRGRQVTEIANHIGDTMKNTSYRLHWLSSMDFIKNLVNGKKGLDIPGAEYLHKLDESQRKVAAARKGQATKATNAASQEKKG